VQIHAISVMASVYPLPSIPELSVFSSETLTQEELDMTPEERELHARRLVQESSYAQMRFFASSNVDNCNKHLQAGLKTEAERTNHRIFIMKIVLWIAISFIIITLTATIILLHLYIFKPLRKYSVQIAANQNIEKAGRISEMQQLVTAYNGLWNYRNKLESILRIEAENDSLTGLPNRYSLEQDLLREELNEKSVAIVMFDVNFLKQTNDTQGHLAGDSLIKNAASSIMECFGIKEFKNCYRIGGDEFVALVPDTNKNEIKRLLEKFQMVLDRENISISVGYAYAEKLSNTNFKTLLDEADKNMYKHKRIIHSLVKNSK